MCATLRHAYHPVMDETETVVKRERVRNQDGDVGEIVTDFGDFGIQVLWFNLPGVRGATLLVHNRAYVDGLERL